MLQSGPELFPALWSLQTEPHEDQTDRDNVTERQQYSKNIYKHRSPHLAGDRQGWRRSESTLKVRYISLQPVLHIATAGFTAEPQLTVLR